MSTKLWIGDHIYLVDDPVYDEIERLSCEGERLKGEGELADKVIADLSCEGERYRVALELVLDDYEGYSFNSISKKYDVPVHDPEILAKAQAALVSEGLKQK